MTLSLEDTLSGNVFRSGQLLLIPDLEETLHPILRHHNIRNHPLPKAAVLVPLKIGEETIGVLFVARQNAFSTQDIRLLTTLADIGGSAIQRQQLHEQATRRARQMTYCTASVSGWHPCWTSRNFIKRPSKHWWSISVIIAQP